MYLYGSAGNAIAVEDFTGEEVEAYTYVKDAQGSTCQLTDESGEAVTNYEYDDYGVTNVTGTATVNVLAYTGGVYDEETGQYYLNARYYDPEQGVFLTQDTYRGEQNQPATWNLYGYCGGNPVNYVDPSGHKSIKKTVWDFFISKKFAKVQVAGIMGNVMQESSWNPLRRSSGSQYWGLLQLNKGLALKLEKKYKAAGLNMKKYGYNVSKYQGIGAQKRIPKKDLSKILNCQLKFIYTCKPTGANWISSLKKAKNVNIAAEIFLVKFEGAVTNQKLNKNKIKYYSAYNNKYYQDADQRRKYAVKCYNEFA